MKGSVRKRGKTWSYRVDLGKIDGVRNQVEKGGYKTEREATKAMNDVIYQFNNTGDYVENQKVTFQENFNTFMVEEAEVTRAYSTRLKYDSIYRNHLGPAFGPNYLYQISSDKIKKFLKEKGQKYSEQFLKSIYKALNVLFSYAYQRKLLKKNPMDDVDPPPDSRHQNEYKFLTKEERDLIEARILTTNVQSAYYIGINTGVRVSECFGLCWPDIDFARHRVRINKQLRFEDKKWCFTPLKTKCSYRDVEVTDDFLDYLRYLKDQQERNRYEYGEAYHNVNVVWDRREKNHDDRLEVTDLINVKQNGAMMTSDSEKFLARIIKADLGIQFKYHNLRHTYATILAEDGANPKYVQRQLGHAKLEFTLRYYTHVTDKMGERAMGTVHNEIGAPLPLGRNRKEKDEGVLVPAMGDSNLPDIRLNSRAYYGGLSENTKMEVWLDDRWAPTRLELVEQNWVLEGLETTCIWGLRVRL